MKNLAVPVLVSTLVLSSAMANAGGPVIVEEEGKPEVIAEKPRSGWIVPVVVGVVLLCAVVCGKDDTPVPLPE